MSTPKTIAFFVLVLGMATLAIWAG